MVLILDIEGECHPLTSARELIGDDLSPAPNRLLLRGIQIREGLPLLIGHKAVSIVDVNVEFWHFGINLTPNIGSRRASCLRLNLNKLKML